MSVRRRWRRRGGNRLRTRLLHSFRDSPTKGLCEYWFSCFNKSVCDQFSRCLYVEDPVPWWWLQHFKDIFVLIGVNRENKHIVWWRRERRERQREEKEAEQKEPRGSSHRFRRSGGAQVSSYTDVVVLGRRRSGDTTSCSTSFLRESQIFFLIEQF